MTESSISETSLASVAESASLGTVVQFSAASPTPSPLVMSTTRFTRPAAGGPTTVSHIPTAADASSSASSIMIMGSFTMLPTTAATNSIPASLSMRPTNGPSLDTSDAASVPTAVESRSKASAGSIAGGIVGALLAIAAIFAVFFLVRRNRRAKAAEGILFDRSYFRKSAVKLDDAAVNTIQNPSPLPARMMEHHVDVVRSPSISSYVYIEQGHGMDAYQPAADDLQEQQYPLSTPAYENPFMSPTEDAFAAGAAGYGDCGHSNPVPNHSIVNTR